MQISKESLLRLKNGSQFLIKLCNLFLGKIKFLASKFVRPPKDFRQLYGPEIRQTVLDSYFLIKKAVVVKAVVPTSGPKTIRQTKINQFFK